MDEVPSPRPSVSDRIRLAWHTARLWLVFALGFIGIVLALSIPTPGQSQVQEVKAGQVAPSDLSAPFDLSFTSQILTDQARQAAAERVPEVFDPPDAGVARLQLERLTATLNYIASVRTDTHATEEQRLDDLTAMADLRLDVATSQAILSLAEARWQAVASEAASVLEQVMQREIREGKVDEARRTIPALVSIALPENQASLVIELVSAFVAPNALYNEQATQEARETARRKTAPVIKSYSAGETIVARGQVITPLHVEALQAFGLLRPGDRWREVATNLLFAAVVASLVSLYAYRLHSEQIKSVKLAALLAGVLVVAAVGLKLMVPGRTVLPYLFPSATFPILLATLFGPGMGVVGAFTQGALAALLSARGLELGLYVMFGGMLGALMIGRAERLSSFFWSGLASDLGAVAAVVIFRFPDPAMDAFGKATLTSAALANGFLSASLSFGLLLLIGSLMGITTSLQLIELSRPDHPLLHMILREAPGTYQHSLQVANLAEQAARSVGANALLTRVGALYHDAGKSLKPQFYIENQISGQNIHEQLDPATSASIIVSHVRDGLELARKHRLPAVIRAFIPEHHGTLEASFQYLSALEAAGGDPNRVKRSEFAYPGPRPRSSEAAILMLADGVEALARAEAPEDDEAIDRLVRWVIQDRVSKGQLDRADLTFKDLDTVRRSFVNTLKGIYHPRIRYPQAALPPELQPPKAPAATDGP